MLFLSGFGVGAVALFLAVSNIFNMVKWSNCWVLGIVPLIGGLILGILVLKVVKLAFFCIGAATGGILCVPFPPHSPSGGLIPSHPPTQTPYSSHIPGDSAAEVRTAGGTTSTRSWPSG